MFLFVWVCRLFEWVLSFFFSDLFIPYNPLQQSTLISSSSSPSTSSSSPLPSPSSSTLGDVYVNAQLRYLHAIKLHHTSTNHNPSYSHTSSGISTPTKGIQTLFESFHSTLPSHSHRCVLSFTFIFISFLLTLIPLLSLSFFLFLPHTFPSPSQFPSSLCQSVFGAPQCCTPCLFMDDL
jgi:hypothetical protein